MVEGNEWADGRDSQGEKPPSRKLTRVRPRHTQRGGIVVCETSMRPYLRRVERMRTAALALTPLT